MNAVEHGQRVRLYRLWRTAAILCGLGAVEIGVLAWQRQRPALAIICLPLVAVAVWAARRGAVLRRTL